MKKILLILFSGLLFCNVTHAQQVSRQISLERDNLNGEFAQAHKSDVALFFYNRAL